MGRRQANSGLIVSLVFLSTLQFSCAFSAPAMADSAPPELQDSIPPVANAGPDQTVDEDTIVQFDGSASTDDLGIANYTWTFTDVNTVLLMGMHAIYRFTHSGIFIVRLEVEDYGGNTDNDTVNITVLEPPPPPLSVYENSKRRFRIEAPGNWDVDMNFNDPGQGEIDLLAMGPHEGSYYTNLLVISNSMSVSESDTALLEIANGSIEEIIAEYGPIRMSLQPKVIPTKNSRASVFSYFDDNESMWQFIGIVLSAKHTRMWVIVLTADLWYADHYDYLAEQIVGSFEILPPESADLMVMLVPIIVILVIALLVVALLVIKRKRARMQPSYQQATVYGTSYQPVLKSPPQPQITGQPQQAYGGTVCPYCGIVSAQFSRVCPNCGRAKP